MHQFNFDNRGLVEKGSKRCGCLVISSKDRAHLYGRLVVLNLSQPFAAFLGIFCVHRLTQNKFAPYDLSGTHYLLLQQYDTLFLVHYFLLSHYIPLLTVYFILL